MTFEFHILTRSINASNTDAFTPLHEYSEDALYAEPMAFGGRRGRVRRRPFEHVSSQLPLDQVKPGADMDTRINGLGHRHEIVVQKISLALIGNVVPGLCAVSDLESKSQGTISATGNCKMLLPPKKSCTRQKSVEV